MRLSAIPSKIIFLLFLIGFMMQSRVGFPENIYMVADGEISQLSLGDTIIVEKGGVLFIASEKDALDPSSPLSVLLLSPKTVVKINESRELKLTAGEFLTLTRNASLGVSLRDKVVTTGESGKYFFSYETDSVVAYDTAAIIKMGERTETLAASPREVTATEIAETPISMVVETSRTISDRPSLGSPQTPTIPTTPLDSGGGTISCR